LSTQPKNLKFTPILQKKLLPLIFLLSLAFCQVNPRITGVAVNEVDSALVNGDFEYGDLTGWTTGTGLQEAHIQNKENQFGAFYVHSGNYGVALITYDQETWIYTDAWIEQELNDPIVVEEGIEISFWAKFYSNHIIRLTVTYTDETISTHDFSESYGAWHEYLFSDFSLNKKITKIRIERIGGDNTSSTTAIDDIRISMKDEVKEVIKNGDFEYGDLTGWKTGTGLHEAHIQNKENQFGAFYVHSGNYGVALITYDQETWIYTDAWIEQDLSSGRIVDEYIELTFWAKLFFKHIIRVSVTYTDMATNTHDFSYSTGNWFKYSVTDLALGKEIITIRFDRIGGGNTASTTAIDDISLKVSSNELNQFPFLTPGFTIFYILLCLLLIGILKRRVGKYGRTY
jgi:hypothetical protein